jgi:hypothetical protein
MYGDTFAHRQIPCDNEQQGQTLYPTGRGHAFDAHFPDDVQCNRLSKRIWGTTLCTEVPVGVRFNIWADYIDQSGNLLMQHGPHPAQFNEAHPDTNDCAIAARDPRTSAIACAAFRSIRQPAQGFNPDADDAASDLAIAGALSIAPALPPAVIAKFANQHEQCDNNLQALASEPALPQIGLWLNETAAPAATQQGRCARAWQLYAVKALRNLQYCEQMAKNLPTLANDNDKGNLQNCVNNPPLDDQWRDLVLNTNVAELANFGDPGR